MAFPRAIKDRAVQYPGRYKLTPVAGSQDVFDLTAQPGVVSEAGMPINKAYLDPIEQILYLNSTIFDLNGVNGVYTVDISGVTDYTDILGIPLRFKTKTAATVAISINVNALGAKPGKKSNGDNVDETTLNGVYTFVYDGINFILQGEGGLTKFFGDGSDGDFNTVGNVTFTVANQDSDSLVKNFNNFTVNTGHIVTVDKRVKGAVFYIQGDLVVNGTVDFSGKGAKRDPTNDKPAVIITQAKKLLDVLNSSATLQPKLGNGGNGGKGGQAGEGPTYFTGGDGGTGLAGVNYSGGPGGGGGGGAGWCNNGGGMVVGGLGGNAHYFNSGAGGAGVSSSGGLVNGKPGGVGSGGSGAVSVYSTSAASGKGGSNSNGSGGGSGGAASSNGYTASSDGGEGTGWGGPLLIFIVRGSITIGATGAIKANGGNGGGGSNGVAITYSSYLSRAGGGGGGGGAGGGAIWLNYGGTYTNNGVLQVNGGSGGSGGSSAGGGASSSGVSGTAGSIGTIVAQKI